MTNSGYNFAEIEKRWQQRWKEEKLFVSKEGTQKKKYYVLTMYPYPSGVLHMGHVLNYTIGDVVSRYKILQGYDVLSPMGWDSFGLPAENAAIRTGVHPHKFTEKNISRMKEQMNRAGWGYDWDREVATSHTDYYKWTQWLFLQFYKKGLAEKKEAPVNWCDNCRTVLANEQVIDSACERCGTAVRQKGMSQWFLTMKKYAQRLLDGHENLRGKWPDSVLAMQEEWIGRSSGAMVNFKIEETGDEISVFTTRPDTLWGVTFISLAPEHPLVEKLVKGTELEDEVMGAVKKMLAQGTSEKDLADREKVGVFTGSHVINPVNNERVPLWVANFALMSYGTGIVMSVPAHDQRDFEFARKYDLPIHPVILPQEGLNASTMECAFEDDGKMVSSGPFTGKENREAMPDIIKWLEEKGFGKGVINYRLRDWLISRQRYWGAPIPIIYCDDCGIVPVPEEDLPVVLPTDVEFSEDGGNPLASSESFTKTKCPKCGKEAKRETDTMDTFVDSSWYFLRFCDPTNNNAPFDREKIKKLMPVDQYMGGIEHATMHLIYARFFTMVLHDLGMIDFEEPFTNLFCQGMVCKTGYYCNQCKWIPEYKVEGGEKKGDGIEGGKCAVCGSPVRAEMTKISKSKLNIVDPEAMFDEYGADTVRLYMLSDAPPDRMQIWGEDGIKGSWRMLNRFWHLVVSNLGKVAQVGAGIPKDLDEENRALRRKTHQCVFKVTEAIEGGFHFNTAIARCNELLNQLRAVKGEIDSAVLRETLETVIIILSPVIPHFSEEIWKRLGHDKSLFLEPWPVADKKIAAEEMVEIPIQVNGKVKARLKVEANISKEDLEKLVFKDTAVKKHTDGKKIKKIVIVSGRLVNVAVSD